MVATESDQSRDWCAFDHEDRRFHGLGQSSEAAPDSYLDAAEKWLDIGGTAMNNDNVLSGLERRERKAIWGNSTGQ